MHAIYLFYTKTDSIETIIERFEDWADVRCTANNHYQMMYAVNSKGDQRILVEDGDRRGRDKTAKKFIKEEDTVEKMHRFAWECVLYDCGAFRSELNSVVGRPTTKRGRKIADKVENMPLDEIGDWFLKEVQGRIIEAYSIGWNGSASTEGFRRRSMVKYFEALLDLKRYDSGPLPFAERGDPTDFRAFRLWLSEDMEKDGESILAVDIHT